MSEPQATSSLQLCSRVTCEPPSNTWHTVLDSESTVRVLRKPQKFQTGIPIVIRAAVAICTAPQKRTGADDHRNVK